MKHLILIVIIIFAACKKKTTQTPVAPPTQNNLAAPPSNLNAWEIPMAFDWKMFKYYGWSTPNPAPPLINTTYTNNIDCHLLLTSTSNTSQAYPTAKRSEDGKYTCNPTVGIWFISEQNILNVDGLEYRIQLVTNDTLILTNGRATTAYTSKYKLWK